MCPFATVSIEYRYMNFEFADNRLQLYSSSDNDSDEIILKNNKQLGYI